MRRLTRNPRLTPPETASTIAPGADGAEAAGDVDTTLGRVTPLDSDGSTTVTRAVVGGELAAAPSKGKRSSGPTAATTGKISVLATARNQSR